MVVLCHLGEGIEGEMSAHVCYQEMFPDFLSTLVENHHVPRADFNKSRRLSVHADGEPSRPEGWCNKSR